MNVKKKISKVEFLNTARLLIQKENVSGLHYNVVYNEDDLYSGMYDFDCVKNYDVDYVTDEETRACELLVDFFENRVPVKVSFEDIKETYYDWRCDAIRVSPRVNKFARITDNSDLKQIILMMYLRSFGIRGSYQSGEYEKVLNDVIDQCGGTARRNTRTGEISSVTNVPEAVWNNLLRVEFRIEQVAWDYAEKVLESENYYISGEGYIDKKDLNRLKKYFLYKKVCQLHSAREKRELRFLDSHIFRY